jgi:hypothetical protein
MDSLVAGILDLPAEWIATMRKRLMRAYLARSD